MYIRMNNYDYMVVRMALNTTIGNYRKRLNNVWATDAEREETISTLYSLSRTYKALDEAYRRNESVYEDRYVEDENPF